MSDDAWADLAEPFVDRAYASVKGHVRTFVMHHQLLEHLPEPPASILDVGGGAGHQSFPLARAGYDVTLLDSSPAMLDKARDRLQQLPAEARQRVELVQGDGENASEAVGGRRFAAVLCHGVLGYLEDPKPLVGQLCLCASEGGVVSIMTANARATAVQPALERRWDDALAAFDTRSGIGVLGVQGRADTVEDISELLRHEGVDPLCWYGVWLFVDWLEFSGVELDPGDSEQLAAIAAVEIEGRSSRPLPPAQSRLPPRGSHADLATRPLSDPMQDPVIWGCLGGGCLGTVVVASSRGRAPVGDPMLRRVLSCHEQDPDARRTWRAGGRCHAGTRRSGDVGAAETPVS